jgi:glycerol-3-phosphate responsive antiterminator
MRTPDLSGAMLPAVRDGSTLNAALDLGYRQLLLERGSLLALLGPVASAAKQGIAIFVNLDGVEGLAPDSAALAFLATDLGFSGVVSVKPHALKDASRFRLRTVQRIHAIDSTGLETGLSSIVVPSPYAIAISPAVAVPVVIDRVRTMTSAPVWGTGFVTSPTQAWDILAAGAAVASSSRPEVWQAFAPRSAHIFAER